MHTDNEVKVCLDCKHYRLKNGYGDLCMHPASFSGKNIMTKEPIYMTCLDQRKSNKQQHCGKTGRNFEVRETLLYKIKSFLGYYFGRY